MGNLLLITEIGCIAFFILRNIIFAKNLKLRFFCTLFSAVVAFVLTLVFKRVLTPQNLVGVIALVEDLGLPLESLMNASEASSAAILALLSAAVAPIIFVVIFIALNAILCVFRFVVLIIRAIIPGHKKPKFISRVIFGTAQAILCVACMLVPVSVYAEVADIALTESSIIPEEQKSSLSKPIAEVNSSLTIKAYRYCGGSLVSSAMTKIQIENGDKTVSTDLKTEIPAMLDFASDILTLASVQMQNYTEKETQALEGIGTSLTESVILGEVASDVIGSATEAWGKGEPYLGIPKPSIDPKINPLLDRTVEVLAQDHENITYLSEDINTFAKIISKLISSNALSSLQQGGSDAFTNALLNDNLVSSLLDVINQNPRMRVLIPTLTNIGLSLVSESLGLPENATEAYNKLTTDIAQGLSTSASLPESDRINHVKTAIKDSLSDLMITDIDESEVTVIAAALLGYFDGQTNPAQANVTAADIDSFLQQVVGAMNESSSVNAPVAFTGDSKTVKLNASPNAAVLAGQLLAAINEASVNPSMPDAAKRLAFESAVSSSALFENFDNTVRQSVISKLNEREISKIGASVKALSSITSTDGEISLYTFTTEDILIDIDALISSGQISDDTANALTECVKQMFSGGMRIIKAMSDTALSDTEKLNRIMTDLGKILDVFSANESFYGEQKTVTLTKALMSSEKISAFSGISGNDISAILSAKGTHGTSYGAVMNSVSDATAVLDTVKKGEKINDEQVSKLVDSLSTEGSGAVVSTVITEERIIEMGVSDPVKAESTTALVKDVFNNISSITDEEERQKESTAVKHIMSMLVVGTEENPQATDVFGENGKLESSADDIVDAILDSKAVSGAMSNNTFTSNPFGLTLTDNDSEAITNAVEARRETATPEQIDVLNDILLLFGAQTTG